MRAARDRRCRALLARWRGVDRARTHDRDGDEQWIRWVDVTRQGWQLHASPLSIADVFRRQVTDSGRAWIFTSATLAVGSDFSLYQRELGLADARDRLLGKPVRLRDAGAAVRAARSAAAQLAREHTEAVVAAALPVLKASGGRAFLLFTTLRALARRASCSSRPSRRERLDWPLLRRAKVRAASC